MIQVHEIMKTESKSFLFRSQCQEDRNKALKRKPVKPQIFGDKTIYDIEQPVRRRKTKKKSKKK